MNYLLLLTYTCALLLLLCFTGCSDPYNAEQVGRDYCNCLEEELAGSKFELAEKSCKERFALRNRYFRAFHMGRDSIPYSPLTAAQKSYSLNPQDSFRHFSNRLWDYLHTNCPYSTYLAAEDSLDPTVRLIPRSAAFDFMRGVESCIQAESLAQQHAMNGEYRLIDWGMPGSDGYSRFYDQYLLDHYHIQIVRGGCVSFDVPDCYDAQMRQLLSEKYDTATLNYMLFKEPRAAYTRLKQNKP